MSFIQSRAILVLETLELRRHFKQMAKVCKLETVLKKDCFTYRAGITNLQIE